MSTLPRIKLHFSLQPPPQNQPEAIDKEQDVFQDLKYTELSPSDDQDVCADAGSNSSLTPVDSFADVIGSSNSTIEAEPTVPFKGIRLILKATKRKSDEIEEEQGGAAIKYSPKKKKRRKSKSSNRKRHDSSTSSEENTIQTGFKTLSGRTIINPNIRKEPPSESTLPSRRKPKEAPLPHFESYVNENGRNPTSIFCFWCKSRREKHNNKIVLCDGCDKAFHQKCHEPEIENSFTTILEKQWFCYTCNGPIANNHPSPRGLGKEGNEDKNVRIGSDADDHVGMVTIKDLEGSNMDDEDKKGENDGNSGSDNKEIHQDQGERVGGAEDGDQEVIPSDADMTPLTSEEKETYLNDCSHEELIRIILMLEGNPGARFFPPDIRSHLETIKKRPATQPSSHNTAISLQKKDGNTATSLASTIIDHKEKLPEGGDADEEEEIIEERDAKHRKLYPWLEPGDYWYGREDPDSPAFKHFVFRDGVRYRHHELYPPPTPFPGRSASRTELDTETTEDQKKGTLALSGAEKH